MPKLNIAISLLCLLTAVSLGCSSSATGTASRRDAYALASCTDTVSCCVQRNPAVPEACGLTASEAAAYTATMDAAMQHAQDKAKEEEDDAEDGWREHCTNTYVACRDQKKPRWDGDCYACFRYCEGQRQWPFELCNRRSR
uniref:FruE protein n=1 Tax=Myxococcus xanthus TaxID=34 RepID=Q6I7K5_MYXXA|nr:fruE [Myxococcus xanthus DZF1]